MKSITHSIKKILSIFIVLFTVSFFNTIYGLTFIIKNNSLQPDKDIYLSIVGANGYWDFASNSLKNDIVKNIPTITLDKLIQNKIELSNTKFIVAKLFISIGKPLPVDFNGGGYTTPLPFLYPQQKFDYIEFTTGGIVNTSQVDFFGLSLKLETNNQAVGFEQSTSEILTNLHNEFENSKNPSAWNTLFKGQGIINPAVLGTDDPNFGYNGLILKNIINKIVNKNSFAVMDKNGNIYTAKINKDSETIDIETPSGVVKILLSGFNTFNIFANNLPLATDSISDNYTNFHGAIPAAILRGVFSKINNWNNPKAFTYINDPFAKALHANGIDNKAYAMGYDDINNNSSSLTIGNSVTVTIQPIVTNK